MAIFCPTCGLENQPDRNFCRGCGTNLRVVKAALERGPARHPQAERALAAKHYVADVILKKVGELQLNKGDLEKLASQMEKLLASEEVQKVRHLRNAIISVAAISAAVCFFGLAFLGDAHAPAGLMAGVIISYITVVVPALIFVLYRQSRSLQRQGSPGTAGPEAGSDQVGPPSLTPMPPTSVTEHTTQQLGETVVRPPESQATRSR